MWTSVYKYTQYIHVFTLLLVKTKEWNCWVIWWVYVSVYKKITPFFWSGCAMLLSQQKHMSFSFSAFSPTLHNVVLFVCSLALPVNKVLSHSSFNWHPPRYCWLIQYICIYFWPFLHLSFKSSAQLLLSYLLLFLLLLLLT